MQRYRQVPMARRAGSFIAWWVVLMAFWVWVDDSLSLPELLAGAGAATIGAVAAELVQSATGTRFRPRAEWFSPVVRLPQKVIVDTAVVMGALWRLVVSGEVPPSRFHEVALGKAEGPGGVSRRAVVTALWSFAPNVFALGIDRRRGTITVHELVPEQREGDR